MMKGSIFRIFVTIGGAFLFATAALADGEDINKAGTRWVDPVEFYHLQDISRTDFSRDYDQGDIDFNKVMKEKGVKVYGLRLKPFCGAGHVEKFARKIIGSGSTLDISYQDLYGVQGVPINEAGFCVYFDESVSRTYTIDYTVVEHWTHATWKLTCKDVMNISALQLVHKDSGIGFSYAMTANGNQDLFIRRDGVQDHSSLHHFKCDKSAGVNDKFGHFIYFQGARDLIVMLSAPATLVDVADNTAADRKEMMSHPWARVYFFVEQILVEADAAAAEEAAITGEEPEAAETPEELTKEDKEELAGFVSGLMAWLSGEGDPFGFGEHTDATESAVVNAIATVVSIVAGAGIGGFIGSTGASIASGITDAILAGMAGGAPPPTPNIPDIDSIKPPKRPDEEEEGEAPPPPPTEPPGQDPFASEVFKQYVTQDSDGDLIVKDPVMGNETLYTNNGDGTYKNSTTEQDWSPEEIGEQLDYRDRNSNHLKQNAEQAIRWKEEQRAQWDAQNERDRQRGYSDEMKDFRDWKAAQEAAEKKRDMIKKLAEEYGVPPTEESIKKAIRLEQGIEGAFADENRKLGDAFDKWAKGMDATEKVCDAGVNIMATCVPGGAVVKNVYTFVKEPLVGLSEAVAEEKGVGGAISNIVVGMGKGALGVVQNEAGNLTKGMPDAAWKEYGVTILTENLKTGMSEFYKTGDLSKTSDAMIKATGIKSVEFGFGKLVNIGFNKMKGSASSDSWLNKPKSLGIGTRADVYKIRVDGNVSLNDNISKLGISTSDGVGKLTKIIGVSKTPGFSKFYSGAVDLGGLAEGTVNEAFTKFGAHNWGGTLAQKDVAMRVEGLSYVIYGADKAVDYMAGLGEEAIKYAKS